MRDYRTSPTGRAVLHDCRARYLADPLHAEQNRLRSRAAREEASGVSAAIPEGYERFVLEAFEERCASCGRDHSLELDHHFPLEDGNPLLHNAVPLCRSCNARKNSKHPLTFYGGWRATEILVVLHELRERFAERFGTCSRW